MAVKPTDTQGLPVVRPGAGSASSGPGGVRRGPWGPLPAYLATAFVVIVLAVMATPELFLLRHSPEPASTWGDVALVAPFDFSISDPLREEYARRLVEETHTKVFRTKPGALEEALGQLDQLLGEADLAAATDATLGNLEADVTRRTGLDVGAAASLLATTASRALVRQDVELVLRRLYERHTITADKPLLLSSMNSGRLRIEQDRKPLDAGTTVAQAHVLSYPGETFRFIDASLVPEFRFPLNRTEAYAALARQLVRPNLIYDRERTDELKQAEYARQRPTLSYRAGDIILQPQQRVGEREAAALDFLARSAFERAVRHFALALLFIFLGVLFVVRYARKFVPALSFRARDVLMAALPVIFAVSLGRFGLNLLSDPIWLPALFPAALVGMFTLILFGAQFALLLVMLSTVLFAFTVPDPFPVILAGLTSGFTGVASLYTIKERKQVLFAGLLVSLACAVTMLAAGFAAEKSGIFWPAIIGGTLNGIVCYALTIAGLPLFEALFGVTTEVRLMELTSVRHPLLMQLEEKAPGTYQHTLNVAKLAETGAEAVQADFLLVRAGALFHDVGKMGKPKYFTENQNTAEEKSVHSRLSPFMSALIIKNHVKDGVEMARQHHLPEKVVAFIPEHHGTSLIRFFFTQAQDQAEFPGMVREDEFRYPGPKPQTKETAIVMLADSVEATVTAKLQGRSADEDDIRKIVREAIVERFDDGQFDECPLTFRELDRISEAFVATLLARFHSRVDYPGAPKRTDTREGSRTGQHPTPVPGGTSRSAATSAQNPRE